MNKKGFLNTPASIGTAILGYITLYAIATPIAVEYRDMQLSTGDLNFIEIIFYKSLVLILWTAWTLISYFSIKNAVEEPYSSGADFDE